MDRSAARLQRSDDPAERPFARPAIGNAFGTNLQVFRCFSNDVNRGTRRVLQDAAEPRDQRLAVKFNESLVAAEPAAAASGQNEAPYICG